MAFSVGQCTAGLANIDPLKVRSPEVMLMMQAEQLKQKDDALAERTAYIGKLEWRLLGQHKALEEKRGKAAPSAGKPPARKPQLTGE